jgi:hypothetical protein
MKDFTKQYPSRKMRVVWVVDDTYNVRRVQAFTCATDGGDPEDYLWWVPEIGYSVGESSLYATELEAAKAAYEAAAKASIEANKAHYFAVDQLMQAHEKEQRAARRQV